MSGRRRQGSGGSGQGLVEFALVVPVFFVLLFGIVELGRAAYAYNTLASAARVGARVVAVNQLVPPNTNTSCNEDMPIEDQANPHWSAKACAAASATSLGLTPAAVTLSYSAPPNTTLSCSPTLHVGCIATVTVAWTWTPITPLISNLVGSLNLSATSQIPIEEVLP